MSLINEALQDLDARGIRDRGYAISGEDEELSLDVAQPSSHLRHRIFLLAMFICCALYLTYQAKDLASKKQDNLLASMTTSGEEIVNKIHNLPLGLNSTIKLPVSRLAPSSVPIDLVSNVPSDAKKPSANPIGVGESIRGPREGLPTGNGDVKLGATTSPIEERLIAAQKALQKNRLTIPPGDNAVGYYREILEISPHNPIAKAGLEKVAERYQRLVSEAVRIEDANRLRYLLGRVSSAQIDLKNSDDYKEALVKLTRSEVVENRRAPISSADDAVRETYSTLGNVREERLDEQTVVIVKTVKSQDKHNSEVQRKRYQSGAKESAKLALEDFIHMHNHRGVVKSLLVLFDMYMSEGQYSEASTLAQRSSGESELHAYLNARLFVAEKDISAALLQLEKFEVHALQQRYSRSGLDSSLYEKYVGLLAAIYQQQKKHQPAASLYQILVSLNPSNSSYWLGLAVCSDAVGRQSNALSAYRRLSQLGGVEKNIQLYIEERQKILSGELSSQLAGADVLP